MIVVGLPTELSGNAGPAAERGRRRGRGAPGPRARGPHVELVDERFTTVIAQRSASVEAGVKRRKRKGVVDKVAAAVMLQSYLEAHP